MEEKRGYIFMEILLKQNVFIYVMVGLCVIGVLNRFIVCMRYKKLCNESENMGLSKKEFLRAIKLKYENCFKLKLEVNNVDAFINKYVGKLKLCGISINRWEIWNTQLIVLCYLAGIISAYYLHATNHGSDEVIKTLIVGIAAGSVLLYVSIGFGVDNKRTELVVNMKDYLENYLKNRIMQQNKSDNVKMQDSTKKVQLINNDDKMTELEYLKNCMNEIASTQNEQEDTQNYSEEEIIEDILRGFFSEL